MSAHTTKSYPFTSHNDGCQCGSNVKILILCHFLIIYKSLCMLINMIILSKNYSMGLTGHFRCYMT